jgi:hypothetical protein
MNFGVIVDMEITRDEIAAVVHALKQMFTEEERFSICTVRDCMAVTRVPETRSFGALRLYHCAKFKTMHEDARQFVFRTTIENVFGGAVSLESPKELGKLLE